jgi:hypothetical protein
MSSPGSKSKRSAAKAPAKVKAPAKAKPKAPAPRKFVPSPTRKLKVLAYSKRNKSNAAYRDRLMTLKKKFGVAFSFPVSGKLTPQRKGAVTRAMRKYVEFLDPKNRFQFVKASPAVLKKVKAKKGTKSTQVTKTGVFVQVPESRKRGKDGKRKGKQRSRVRISRAGEISVSTGGFVSTVKKFRAAAVLRDPSLIEAEAKRRGAEKVFVSIKGHRGKNEYSIAGFMRYFRESLSSVVEEHIEEEGGAFQNYFSVEFVRNVWK